MLFLREWACSTLRLHYSGSTRRGEHPTGHLAMRDISSGPLLVSAWCICTSTRKWWSSRYVHELHLLQWRAQSSSAEAERLISAQNIVPVCAFGLGAVSCEVIKTPDDINDAAAAAYDILVLSSAETDGKKASALPKVISGNKRVCDVQWLKQCMVSRFPLNAAPAQSVR